MKATMTFAAVTALSMTALACSGAPDAPQAGDPIASDSTSQAVINQGGCSEEQLLQGYFERNGECYGPSDTGGGGGAGGSGRGGAGTQACADRCTNAYDGCTNRCDQRGGRAASACNATCKNSFSRCANQCR